MPAWMENLMSDLKKKHITDDNNNVVTNNHHDATRVRTLYINNFLCLYHHEKEGKLNENKTMIEMIVHKFKHCHNLHHLLCEV